MRPLSNRPKAPYHGIYGYKHRGCRCTACTQANTSVTAEQKRRRILNTPFSRIPHGNNGYSNYDCRCDRCKLGKREYRDRDRRT